MDNVFMNIPFIKPDRKINTTFQYKNYAPMFRRTFNLDRVENATLYVCGLGYGYYYINGKKVTEDRLTAPVSDYTKTLWYNVYDVTALLKIGKNSIAVWCGNGWYNEEMKTSWDYNEAVWRDVPKFILRLDVGDQTVAVSDGAWKCAPESAVYFNMLRSGEYFDAQKYDENWVACDYDDSQWENAIIDMQMPTGIFRQCMCEPLRECSVFNAVAKTKVAENKYLFDIGQNISGYIRLTVCGKKGQELTIRYAEQINDDNSLQLNEMKKHYPESEFQTDKLICSGKQITWSPMFCYHGFRYIEIEGITDSNVVEVCGVFVHQAVERRTEFACSDVLLTKMFQAGVYAVYSNMFYSLTDCPTREKLGWANDAQSSAEQVLTNFKAERVLQKWLQDIFDAMKDSGELPGIIPTSGWGFDWGNGPVSDGILFEIPYRIYQHTANAEPLIQALPYFDRYLNYIEGRTDADGFVKFGLDDWASPVCTYDEHAPRVPIEFINAIFLYKFYRIAELAAKLAGESTEAYTAKKLQQKELVMHTYLSSDGQCTVDRQTAVAMLIYYNMYEDIEPLKKQLVELIERCDFHHDCGMVGLRRLYLALNKCGLEEYAYKIVTATGYPSYGDWFANDATTLWEYWGADGHDDSKNHHMYSDFMSWMIKTILGVNQLEPGYKKVLVEPYFFEDLDWAKGTCKTEAGTIEVFWQKQEAGVALTITVDAGMCVEYNGTKLAPGTSNFMVNL